MTICDVTDGNIKLFLNDAAAAAGIILSEIVAITHDQRGGIAPTITYASSHKTPISLNFFLY